MLNKIKNKIILAAVVIMIANPLLAYAQAAGDTLIQPQDVSIQAGTSDLPDYSQSGVDKSIKEYLCTPSDTPAGNDLANCINKLYRFGIAIGAIALVFFLVMGGYLYIVGGETGKQKAKAVIMNALVGMAILLSSFLLLGFINPDLTVFKPINPPVFIDPGIPDSCEDLGYGEKCKTSDGIVITNPGGQPGSGPSAKTCPGGLVAIGNEIPSAVGSSPMICKDLKDKLIVVANLSKSSNSNWASKWRISSTPYGPGHKSKCHSPGNPQTGTCVDVSFGFVEGSPPYNKGNPSPLVSPRSERFLWLCDQINKAGGIIIHNEAVANGSSCSAFNGHAWATNWHLHLILSQ